MGNKIYPLGTSYRIKPGSLRLQPGEKRGAIKTDQFRCPKKGEYFLSGAIPMAYLAPNDLTCKYWIAKIVKYKIVQQKVIIS